jgi:rhodanese-related sulfurtransferase
LVPSCAEGGVLGVLPGLVGTIQATEGIKLLLGVGEPLIGRLLLVDALTMRSRTVKLRKDPKCPACGTHELRELIDYDQFCGVSAAPPPVAANAIPEITPTVLADRLRRGDDLALIDVREPYELSIAQIPGVRLVPLGTLGDALPTLDPNRETVVICRTGARSGRAVKQLQSRRIHARVEPRRRYSPLERRCGSAAPEVLSTLPHSDDRDADCPLDRDTARFPAASPEVQTVRNGAGTGGGRRL